MMSEKESRKFREVRVKSHWVRAPKNRCLVCRKPFGPDEVVLEKEVHAVLCRFCSEECLRKLEESELVLDDEE